MAKSYVKFEVSKEVAAKALDAVRLAKQSGVVKKGVNEVTKSVERGLSSLVVIAEDIEPEEVIMHIPSLCEQKKIPFVYVPTKQELGKAIGLNVTCAAISIEKAGEGEGAVKDVVSRITGKSSGVEKEAKPASEKKEERAKETKQKKEEKAEKEE
ncbi:50S ribosomal protein L7Ae [Candidatus Marsarchaeota archaeon]|nr:50S ribosomal protein L7Ae [Candidatus Marsarchaeota archaeon]